MSIQHPLRPHWLRPMAAVMGAVALAASLVACNPAGSQDAEDAAAGQQPPPPEVSVVTVKPGTVRLTTDLPGRLEPVRVAQVRARATGVLEQRVFTEGSDVKAGEVLYKIDPAPYQAALQSAKAQQAQAEAQLADASARARRYKPLVEAHAVSQQEYDAAVAAARAAQAQVEAGKAAVRSAQINLGYATVTAPIAGRIGRSLVTEGALVSQQEGTQLATIQQIDRLYVNFTRPASEILRLRKALADGDIERARGDEAARVDVVLENGEPYAHSGRLLFTDLTVDPGTGQVNLRAEIPNPEGMLLPGMYVRVQLEQAQIDNAILLPQQAVTRTEQGNVVTVIDDDGTPRPEAVQIEGSRGHNWIVTDGLEAGDKVLVEGAMKLAMGAQKVKPVPWKPEADDATEADSPPPATGEGEATTDTAAGDDADASTPAAGKTAGPDAN